MARAESGPEALAGRVAELHPDALAAWDLRAERVIVAELAIAGLDIGAPLPRARRADRRASRRSSATWPSSSRETRTAAEVAAAIRRHGGALLRGVRLFDLYRGAPLAADEKSLAYRLVFGAKDRTLTEAEVEGAMETVRTGLESDLGGHLRT